MVLCVRMGRWTWNTQQFFLKKTILGGKKKREKQVWSWSSEKVISEGRKLKNGDWARRGVCERYEGVGKNACVCVCVLRV